MARLARVVVPDHPHHVTQRGNGRARTFFGDADYALYRDLLAEHCRAAEAASGLCCNGCRTPIARVRELFAQDGER